MAKLLLRLRLKSGTTKNDRKTHKEKLYVPTELITALQEGLNLSTELFSSPLTFCSELPQYISQAPEDQDFGACREAYSGVWQGSLLCHPDTDDRATLKALRWALCSASLQDTEPLLVAFVLPNKPTSARSALLAHPCIQHITTVKKRDFSFRHIQNQTGSVLSRTSKWDVDIFFVANSSGRQKYLNSEKLNTAVQKALRSMNAGRHFGWKGSAASGARLELPKKFPHCLLWAPVNERRSPQLRL